MNQAEIEILNRAITGFIRISEISSNPVISYYHFGRRRWYTKKPYYNQGRACYRFRGRYTVYRNRAVWIIHNKQEIPGGMIVDHIDLNRTNDHPNNLRLQRIKESHQQGGMVSMDKVLDELCDWFDIQSWLLT